jgi:D-glycero-D-manno-heptose 1,7-bisphosphate phosphatase
MAHGHDCFVWGAKREIGDEASRSAPRRAVFLDRDGTINAAPKVGRYIRRASELKLLPGSARAIRAINLSGALAVVVTNQRWLASTDEPEAAFRCLDERMRELLVREDARLDACYACPHEIGRCDCRKPAPGMLLRAAGELRLDLERSTLIGDSPVDIEAGYAAGVGRRLLIDGVGGPVPPGLPASGSFVDLWEAVEWIV